MSNKFIYVYILIGILYLMPLVIIAHQKKVFLPFSFVKLFPFIRTSAIVFAVMCVIAMVTMAVLHEYVGYSWQSQELLQQMADILLTTSYIFTVCTLAIAFPILLIANIFLVIFKRLK